MFGESKAPASEMAVVGAAVSGGAGTASMKSILVLLPPVAFSVSLPSATVIRWVTVEKKLPEAGTKLLIMMTALAVPDSRLTRSIELIAEASPTATVTR